MTKVGARAFAPLGVEAVYLAGIVLAAQRVVGWYLSRFTPLS